MYALVDQFLCYLSANEISPIFLTQSTFRRLINATSTLTLVNRIQLVALSKLMKGNTLIETPFRIMKSLLRLKILYQATLFVNASRSLNFLNHALQKRTDECSYCVGSQTQHYTIPSKI